MPEIQVYTWQDFETDVEKITKTIKAWKKEFIYIYGIPRGGLPLAVCLSHRLNRELMISPPPNDRLGYPETTLIVDDIADSGKTLKHYREAGYFIATLFWRRQSAVKPDIATREKQDRWIQFPWEAK